jgi:hypothetical protein
MIAFENLTDQVFAAVWLKDAVANNPVTGQPIVLDNRRAREGFKDG